MWRTETENRCSAFHTESLQHRCVWPSWQSTWNQIQPHHTPTKKKHTHTRRHTYHQPSVKSSLCLVRVLYGGGDNDSTHAAAFLGSGFRLTAVGLLSFNKNILVSTLQLLQQRPSERRKQFPKSEFDQRMSGDLWMSVNPVSDVRPDSRLQTLWRTCVKLSRQNVIDH